MHIYRYIYSYLSIYLFLYLLYARLATFRVGRRAKGRYVGGVHDLPQKCAEAIYTYVYIASAHFCGRSWTPPTYLPLARRPTRNVASRAYKRYRNR